MDEEDTEQIVLNDESSLMETIKELMKKNQELQDENVKMIQTMKLYQINMKEKDDLLLRNSKREELTLNKLRYKIDDIKLDYQQYRDQVVYMMEKSIAERRSLTYTMNMLKEKKMIDKTYCVNCDNGNQLFDIDEWYEKHTKSGQYQEMLIEESKALTSNVESYLDKWEPSKKDFLNNEKTGKDYVLAKKLKPIKKSMDLPNLLSESYMVASLIALNNLDLADLNMMREEHGIIQTKNLRLPKRKSSFVRELAIPQQKEPIEHEPHSLKEEKNNDEYMYDQSQKKKSDNLKKEDEMDEHLEHIELMHSSQLLSPPNLVDDLSDISDNENDFLDEAYPHSEEDEPTKDDKIDQSVETVPQDETGNDNEDPKTTVGEVNINVPIDKFEDTETPTEESKKTVKTTTKKKSKSKKNKSKGQKSPRGKPKSPRSTVTPSITEKPKKQVITSKKKEPKSSKPKKDTTTKTSKKETSNKISNQSKNQNDESQGQIQNNETNNNVTLDRPTSSASTTHSENGVDVASLSNWDNSSEYEAFDTSIHITNDRPASAVASPQEIAENIKKTMPDITKKAEKEETEEQQIKKVVEEQISEEPVIEDNHENQEEKMMKMDSLKIEVETEVFQLSAENTPRNYQEEDGEDGSDQDVKEGDMEELPIQYDLEEYGEYEGESEEDGEIDMDSIKPPPNKPRYLRMHQQHFTPSEIQSPSLLMSANNITLGKTFQGNQIQKELPLDLSSIVQHRKKKSIHTGQSILQSNLPPTHKSRRERTKSIFHKRLEQSLTIVKKQQHSPSTPVDTSELHRGSPVDEEDLVEGTRISVPELHLTRKIVSARGQTVKTKLLKKDEDVLEKNVFDRLLHHHETLHKPHNFLKKNENMVNGVRIAQRRSSLPVKATLLGDQQIKNPDSDIKKIQLKRPSTSGHPYKRHSVASLRNKSPPTSFYNQTKPLTLPKKRLKSAKKFKRPISSSSMRHYRKPRMTPKPKSSEIFTIDPTNSPPKSNPTLPRSPSYVENLGKKKQLQSLSTLNYYDNNYRKKSRDYVPITANSPPAPDSQAIKNVPVYSRPKSSSIVPRKRKLIKRQSTVSEPETTVLPPMRPVSSTTFLLEQLENTKTPSKLKYIN